MERTTHHRSDTASLTDARSKFSEIIDDVISTGAAFTVTKRGAPAVVMLAYDDYESLIETVNILSDADTLAAIEEGEANIRSGDVLKIE